MDAETTRSDESLPPQVRRDEPDSWDRDLSPDPVAGQNIGSPSEDPDESLITAHELKEAHQALANELSGDDLHRIPIVRQGQQLQQGATYIDLREGQRKEFTAMGGMVADEAHWYVPKKRVPYPLWNRLLGVDDPARTDQGQSEETDR